MIITAIASLLLAAGIPLSTPGTVCASVAECRTACDKGSMPGCVAAGVMYAGGKGAPHAPRYAAGLFDKACQAHIYEGCWRRGMMEQAGVGTEKDEAAALAHFQSACGAGLSEACVSYAAALEEGRGCEPAPEKAMHLLEDSCEKYGRAACLRLAVEQRERDAAAALKTFQRGCAKGSPQSCVEAGKMLLDKRVTDPAQPAKALAFFFSACDAKFAEGCSLAGLLLLGKHGVLADLPRSRGAFEKACALDDRDACYGAATLLLNEPGGKERARSLLVRSCDLGSGDSCSALADLVRSPLATEDKSLAQIDAYTRACDGGSSTGCYRAAMELRTSKEHRDELRANDLLLRGCKSGSAEACAMAASALGEKDKRLPFALRSCELGAADARFCDEAFSSVSRGLGSSELQARVHRLAAESCAAGLSSACIDLADMIAGGHGVAKNPEAAIRLLDQQCRGGDPDGCASLAFGFRKGTYGAKDMAQHDQYLKRACELVAPKACKYQLIDSWARD